jgi:hypothetical protein
MCLTRGNDRWSLSAAVKLRDPVGWYLGGTAVSWDGCDWNRRRRRSETAPQGDGAAFKRRSGETAPR